MKAIVWKQTDKYILKDTVWEHKDQSTVMWTYRQDQ